MPNDTIGRERPRRRGWDRRRDLGRRMVRDRRRDVILPFERRTSPPEGFHFLDHSNRRGNPNPRGRMDKENPGLGSGEQ